MPSSVPTGVREVWPSCTVRASVAGVDGHRVGPAEHPLVPDAHVRRQRLEDLAAVRAGGHQVPEVDVRVGVAGGVVEVRQAQVVAELVGEDADPGVLRLHDVVRHLQVGAGDGVAAGDRRGVRPDRVHALGAAAARTCPDRRAPAPGGRSRRPARRSCRRRPGRPGPRCRSRPTGSSGPARPARRWRRWRAGPRPRVVRVAVHRLLTAGDPVAVLVLEAAGRGVPALRVRHGDPRAGLPVDRVRALGHLQVHVVHGPAGEADARLAVRARSGPCGPAR